MGISQLLPSLSDEMCFALTQLPDETLRRISEIRIRRNLPLVLVFDNKSFFITKNGKLINHIVDGIYIIKNEEFDLIFKRLCNYSVHCEIDNLINGYITAAGGNRVGVCSSAVYKNGIITAVKEICSLNIRIAKEILNCSRQVLNSLYLDDFPSIIVAAPPAGGKTTFLRDFARQLSGGFNNRFRKVSIIDERNEIAYKDAAAVMADVGYNTDVLTGFSKAKGIEMAIRTQSPEIIICDEIASADEVEAISNGFNSGIAFAVSVHARSREELLKKNIVKMLLATEQFNYIVLLKDYTNDFEIFEVG